MSEHRLLLPEGYKTKLDLQETQFAIKAAKDSFERALGAYLDLLRVSAPLFVRPGSGLNDDLNGVERPVQFDLLAGGEVQVVQSLAKWKRMALKEYGFKPGSGLYTDMNAIRRDEELDNLHSIYVDQWDWEKVILPEQRNLNTLKDTVRTIYKALQSTQYKLTLAFPSLVGRWPKEIKFVTSQELEDRWPDLTPKEREDAICREHGAVCLMQIGGALKSGKPHDGRAPDYDDWDMNCDILVWYPVLDRSIELSSMGVRVSPESLARQLKISGKEDRAALPFHKALLNGELPYTIGGGIGQSRICMVLLEKAHIGEVQASVWPQEMRDTCRAHGIHLL
ncbi:MAG: aspartate--ammonia ligase [Oscillospiraceae bacterium]|nr:aspartate--ammonia ligase [Oscillospiraceae bacterium]